ncbi:MAG: aminodeoxychorismate synthase component I [Betaproteobacteria bacterium]|nr:aminodeoxychorismate synthase component I [Betaproteobacteria bacterium]
MRAAFPAPTQWLVARDHWDVPAVLDEAHARARDGAWCVGWVSYEAAPGLNPAFRAGVHVHEVPRGTVLAAFAVCDPAGAIEQDATTPRPCDSLADWATGDWSSPRLTAAALTERIEAIRMRIRAGDVYQVNLTTQLASELTGDAGAYFEALRRSQPHGYTFLIPHALDGVAECILSVSPELFFHRQGTAVTTQPMKGTAPRSDDAAEDAGAAAHLRESAKERAENLMIVDLLRNDLSRVARTGSVRVPKLFEIHALPTVWQMTSTVTAQVDAALPLSGLMAALFPCGSVTGAPKRMAMSVIRSLEPEPRGVYCGAVGLIRPGGDAIFNVPIRTVTLRAEGAPERRLWAARCGVGSGITYDSHPEAEAREWRDKQRFLARAARPFELLETLRLQDGNWWLLDRHLARLQRCAVHFAYPWSPEAARRTLDGVAAAHASGLYRVRLLLDRRGSFRTEATAMTPTPAPVRLGWARGPMPPPDEFVQFKTTRRERYAPFAPEPGCFDTVLRTHDGLLTETTFGNLVLRVDGEWLTPSVASGLLPGVYREELIAEGRIRETELRVEAMAHADAAAFINSVRGWLDVDWSALHCAWLRSQRGSGR